jgi:hypothetical protein
MQEAISPSFAVDLVLRRRRCRRKMSAWSRHCGYQPALHHRLLIRKLTEVWYGRCNRLMVFMPPGSAKSTYCSVLFPPWYLQHYPIRMRPDVTSAAGTASPSGRIRSVA